VALQQHEPHHLKIVQSVARHVRFVPKADVLPCSEERRYSITSSASPNRAEVSQGFFLLDGVLRPNFAKKSATNLERCIVREVLLLEPIGLLRIRRR
jgi:hypothetical protein